MITAQMKADVHSLRAFLPAKDFVRSTAFYEAVGFQRYDIGPQLHHFQLGSCAFMLQDYYVQEFAENLMMHLMVADADAWWPHLEGLKLAETFGVQPPRAPKLEPWGLKVIYLFDPSGVLWHIASETEAPST